MVPKELGSIQNEYKRKKDMGKENEWLLPGALDTMQIKGLQVIELKKN